MSTIPKLTFSLNPASLQGKVPAANYARGLEAYRLQKVESCKIYGKSNFEWDIVGYVDGSKHESYDVAVTIEVSALGDILRFSGDCSCPVGTNCKHAVALTLKAAYQFGRRKEASTQFTNNDANHAVVESGKPAGSLSTLAEVEAKIAMLKGQYAEQASRQADESSHIAALAAQRKVSQWLDLFDDDDAAAANPLPSADQVPFQSLLTNGRVYVLSATQQNEVPVLQLRVAISRILPNTGKWAKLTAPSYHNDSYCTARDKELQQLIQSQASRGYSYGQSFNQCVLSGSTGQLLLQLALETDKLFTLSGVNMLGKPLRLGEQRSVTWRWQELTSVEDTEPMWRLQAALQMSGDAVDNVSTDVAINASASESAQIYTNNPPMYLDGTAGLCGWVVAPNLTPDRLNLLLKAPPIPQSAFEKSETTLLRTLAGLPLPPVIQAPTVMDGITPQLELRISPVPARDQAMFGLLCATLRFGYDDFAFFRFDEQNPLLLDLPPTPVAPAPASRSLSRVLLHRNIDIERSAHHRLSDLGLRVNHLGQCYLPATQQAKNQWLLWADTDYQALKDAGFNVQAEESLDGLIRRADHLVVQMAGQHDEQAPDGNPNNAANAWFDLSLGMDIDGTRHNILPMLPELLAQLGPQPKKASFAAEEPALDIPPYLYTQQTDGNFLRIPTAPLQPWLQALLDLFGERGGDFGSGDTLRLSRLEAMRVGAALGDGVQWQGADQLRTLVQQLGGRVELPVVAPPSGLQAALRPYQLHGLAWLQFLRSNQLAGILADDMGLGKTLQTLAHILVEKQAGRLDRPALIIAPVSVLGNWRSEAAKFTPELRVLLLHGKERHAAAVDIAQHDIVIAPYSLLQRDSESWLTRAWHVIVLDEAQNIKNANTHAAQVVGGLDTRHRLCLSGTPMENHLGELWSLFHFLMPGFLSSQMRFKTLFRTPIEKHGDTERLEQLRRRITPFMLRRHKNQVASDLPEKQVQISRVELEGKQANLYETIRLTTEKTVREALASKGLAKSQIQILDALLKLRQVCCDPRLVPIAAAAKVKQSAKLEMLMEMLPEMVAEGRRILLFSQFTSMLKLIEAELKKHGIPWVKLTGQSQKREQLIEQFTSGSVPLFLISLKAGGVGLNLTQADTVIHYDPWWNPAVENQATDRAHRIGQTQHVQVYKLVAQGTIEERILALQERKAALADSVYSGSVARKQPLFTESDLAALLLPLGA
jgi:hypothetical protein